MKSQMRSGLCEVGLGKGVLEAVEVDDEVPAGPRSENNDFTGIREQIRPGG